VTARRVAPWALAVAAGAGVWAGAGRVRAGIIPATGSADAGGRVSIDAGAADAEPRWRQVVARLDRCAPVDATLWYAFGSARLGATPAQGGGCRVHLELEIEQAKSALTCALPPRTPWRWNLLDDGAARRQAPPREPPPGLAPFCAREPPRP
jgi:hypothetical protein